MGKDIAERIENSSFFGGLSKTQCQALAAITSIRSVRKRETLFLEDTKGSTMFLLCTGCIQLSKASADGDEVVIRTIKPGEVFAEVILFEKQRYPVTAVAVSASEVIAFAKTDILGLLDTTEFRNEFIAFLMTKQRYLAERVRYLTSYDVEQRFFLFLREHYGESSKVTVSISKRDVAAAIGATPETFSRLTKRLKDEGTIKWNGDEITVDSKVWERLP